jgi:hypothetical protein
MAYDRYGPRDYPREERSRWRGERDDDRFRERGDDRGRDERGFFERAGDEVASWFGDDEAERRRREDRMRDEREGRYRHEHGRDWRGEQRGGFFGSDRDENRDRGYRPLTGDYGRGEGFFAAGGYPRGEYDLGRAWRGTSSREREPSGDRSGGFDPQYRSWRDRHMDELDRDYDEYARENQSRFENEFGGWRERRQQKRGLLGQIREHMEVVGNDDQHVGTIDRVAGDRINLTKSDPESGGVHISLSCSDIDQGAGDRVILDCSAEQAKQRWRDESRSRALFEREDQGEMGPRVLDRSFEGTYR